MSTATTTEIVPLVAGQKVRVCAYAMQGSTTATATTVKLVYGTGASCVTGQTQLTPAWNMPVSATANFVHEGTSTGELFSTAAANALCAVSSAAGTVNIRVTYAQF